MGFDQNLLESSMNVISRFTKCVNYEIREWQFSLFFVILSEKLANFGMISREIVKSLNSQELGVDWISHFRTEVKRHSMKC